MNSEELKQQYFDAEETEMLERRGSYRAAVANEVRKRTPEEDHDGTHGYIDNGGGDPSNPAAQQREVTRQSVGDGLGGDIIAV